MVEMLVEDESIDLNKLNYTDLERNVISEYMEQFKGRFNDIEDRCQIAVEKVRGLKRKEAARTINKQFPKFAGIIFNMMDDKIYKNLIWKIVKKEAAAQETNQ